ncbi:MAG TPA: HlyD family efflux transporter periplasmic adaptor subunit, partial [Bryobacteraceae bacterium]|nr:HlyD family efflux transporter periplasmic adaptor subunit [Bryobacteraceae bacterium]
MSPVPVTYEPASNSAFVAIHGRRYHTETWSTAGFAIYGYYEAAAPGDPLDVRFTINSRETPLSFRASAQVTNAGDGLLAAKFMHLGERERRLLSSSGAAVPEIASAESSGTTEAAAVQPFVRRALRRLLIAAVYLLAGTAIIVFAVLAVLGHLMHVNVETAVISMALEQMISADAGVIAEMKVKPRMPIAAGQVLFRIDSEASARNIQAAREELAGAEIALRQAERRRDSESQRLRVYRNISNDQLEAAHANIAALTAAREEARAEFERQKKLIEHGLISRQLLDHQKSILAERQARVAQAVAEQRIAVTSADTTNAGLFFSGNFLVGDLAGAVAEETAARERVRVARTAVDHAIRQDARRLYRTPFDGIVMKVFKSTGMPVDRGEAVVVLRRANQDPWIDAWLTQDEASRIAAGARGVAVVAATERRYPVEIVSLDRTAGMLDRAQTSKLQQPAWMWRTPEDRSALARFAFIDLSDTERASIEPGSPVLVTVPKTRMFPMRLMQTVQASQEPAPRLWPAGSAIFRGGRVADPGFEPVRLRVIKAADAALRSSPAPVVTIRSAGVVDQSSTELQSSRRAFVDADNFVILALAAKLTGGSEYLDAARRIVSAWASVNQPTGHPIDEARLGGFLWGLDL